MTMNFSAYEGSFQPSSQINQYTMVKYVNENSSSANGTNCQNASVMTDDLASVENRYPNHFNQMDLPVKCQRDISTQVDAAGMSVSPPRPNESIHQFARYDRGGGEAVKQRQQYFERTHDQDIKAEREEDGRGEYVTMDTIHQQRPGMPPYWQSVAAPGSTVADYLSHLPASTLPVSLQHFMKYSSEPGGKRDVETSTDPIDRPMSPARRKRKKKVIVKEKKPRPGSIRLTTALDGSTLYCCPECQMAYPDKSLLEQHLMVHSLERRFFCDICGAGLKRKDHLTRHKLSHNSERPFPCSVCLKAFKRKEQLTLHFVIHSGEKRHICTECGKGFYRKDHLRKHTRSHIARRMKADMSQQGQGPAGAIQAAQPRQKASEEGHY